MQCDSAHNLSLGAFFHPACRLLQCWNNVTMESSWRSFQVPDVDSNVVARFFMLPMSSYIDVRL